MGLLATPAGTVYLQLRFFEGTSRSRSTNAVLAFDDQLRLLAEAQTAEPGSLGLDGLGEPVLWRADGQSLTVRPVAFPSSNDGGAPEPERPDAVGQSYAVQGHVVDVRFHENRIYVLETSDRLRSVGSWIRLSSAPLGSPLQPLFEGARPPGDAVPENLARFGQNSRGEVWAAVQTADGLMLVSPRGEATPVDFEQRRPYSFAPVDGAQPAITVQRSGSEGWLRVVGLQPAVWTELFREATGQEQDAALAGSLSIRPFTWPPSPSAVPPPNDCPIPAGTCSGRYLAPLLEESFDFDVHVMRGADAPWLITVVQEMETACLLEPCETDPACTGCQLRNERVPVAARLRMRRMEAGTPPIDLRLRGTGSWTAVAQPALGRAVVASGFLNDDEHMHIGLHVVELE